MCEEKCRRPYGLIAIWWQKDWRLRKDEGGGCLPEAQEDEGIGPKAGVARTVSLWPAQIFVLVRLISHLAFHDAIQPVTER
jgi:hypothetical protein